MSTRSTVLITGATSGMGRYLATLLSGLGWTVLAHGRDRAKLADLVAGSSGDVQPFRADLSSLAEVRKLAKRVGKATDRLNVLVNNAGVGFGAPGDPREVSVDGNEMRLAVNYLAPVLLTRLLAPLLVKTAPSRVVNVGSLGQLPVKTDDLQMERDYSGTDAYRRAKLALASHSFDLADELRSSRVTVNCIHPASFMATTMVIDSGVTPRSTLEEGWRRHFATHRRSSPGRGYRSVLRRFEDSQGLAGRLRQGFQSLATASHRWPTESRIAIVPLA